MDNINVPKYAFFAYNFNYRTPTDVEFVYTMKDSIQQFLSTPCVKLYREVSQNIPFVRDAQFWHIVYKGNILNNNYLLKQYVLYNATGLNVPLYIQYTEDRFLHIFGIPRKFALVYFIIISK